MLNVTQMEKSQNYILVNLIKNICFCQDWKLSATNEGYLSVVNVLLFDFEKFFQKSTAVSSSHKRKTWHEYETNQCPPCPHCFCRMFYKIRGPLEMLRSVMESSNSNQCISFYFSIVRLLIFMLKPSQDLNLLTQHSLQFKSK